MHGPGDRSGTGSQGCAVEALIDAQPVSRLQWRALGLCCLIAACDGIDTQTLALAVPALRRAWAPSPGDLALMLAAAPVGMLIGGLVLGSAADRLGRRWVVIVSTFIFGAFTLALTLAPDVETMAALRFFAGLGMGGAVANVVTLSAELAPQRLRSRFVTLAFCGVPGGALVAAVIALGVMPAWGPKGLFVVAGAIPLLILPLAFVGLPESARFLAARAPNDRRAQAQLARAYPALAAAPRPMRAPPPPQATVLADLFDRRWLRATLALWIAYISALLVIHFLSNWLPNILVGVGFSERSSILAMIFLNGGAVVGGLTIGQLMDRLGAQRVLVAAYAIAALAVLIAPLLLREPPALMIAILLIGTLALGGQVGMNALAASIYPTALRATGVGWASGLGRTGAIIGPALGGLLLASTWGQERIFVFIAVVLALCGLALALLRAGPGREA